MASRTVDDEDYGGVIFWPEVLKYFLRTFVTSGAIREESITLEDIHQNENADERKYANRLSKEAERCGTVPTSEERRPCTSTGSRNRPRLRHTLS